MGADNAGDKGKALAIWNEITSPSFRSSLTPVEWSRAQVIFHTHLGDLDVATSAAHEHLRLCLESDLVLDQFLGYYYLAHPAFLAGAIDLAADCLRTAIECARTAEAATRELSAVYKLLDLALYTGDKNSATPLLSRLAELLPQNEDIDNWRAAAAFALRCKIHLEITPPTALSSTLDFAVAMSNPIFRSRTQDISTIVLLAVTNRRRLAPGAVSLLRQDIERFGDQGMMDYPFAALVAYEASKGRGHEALQMLRDYLRHRRRERGPLHFVLREVATSLGATADG
jgi:tetratricopeptide (TPR) repeat protein